MHAGFWIECPVGERGRHIAKNPRPLGSMSQLDLHALISEEIRGLEDLRFTSLKALRGMLERRLGISLSDRKREIRHYAEMVVTEIAAGEPG